MVFLVPVRRGDHWRVQLAWNRYFGKFASLPEAERWIAEHLWLTEQVTQRSTQQQPDILDNKG
jgi:hypothetical protein